MAEALGVAASAVTLAGLFTNCIECFHYFKAAQNCPEEAERMLVKLDCEKARLLVWSNTIGLLDANVRGRDPRLAHPSLEDVLRRAIDQVIRLLTDAQDLQTKYGGRPTVESEKQRYLAIISANAMNVFTTSKRRFFAHAGAPSQKPPMSSRLKWAVRDAARFKILLVDLQGFVDNIIQLVQVEPKAINMVIEEDITSMVSISNLRLTEEACEETYPSWSSKASEVIRDSELGTTDRRNREEFLRDVDEQETSTRSEADFADQIAFTDNPTLWVLTDKCLDLEPHSHCEVNQLGEAVTSSIEMSFTSAPESLWNLGRRIYDCIGLPVSPWELQDIAYDKPLLDLRIHCGPCGCAIHTAMSLCCSKDVSSHYRFSIHIHDRLPTSCRRASSPLEVMEALRDGLEGFQLTDKYDRLQKALSYINSPALEKRIYDMEQELFEPVNPENVLQAVLLDVLEEQQRTKQREKGRSLGADIFIVEADNCQQSLQNPPFKAEVKKPRATNIFELSRPQDQGSKPHQGSRPHQIAQRYIGSYYRSKGAIQKRKSEADQVPLVIPGWSST